MKRYIIVSRFLKLILLFFVFLGIASCGSGEYHKVPLESLDKRLELRGNNIAKDIIVSLNHEDGARYLLKKEYITPLVHGRIIQNLEMYNEAYQIGSMIIGNVSDCSLFEVIDKGIVKTMRYKLVTDAEDMKFIELKLDINRDLELADYYLYISSKDETIKRENILPKAYK